MNIKNKNGERIIIGISEVHLAELENKENLQKRIKLKHETAMVDFNCTQKTIDISFVFGLCVSLPLHKCSNYRQKLIGQIAQNPC